MAIELKQNLKLTQQLVITPQLQQAIKLLQLSRIELADLIQDELLENPILEEGPQAEDEEIPAEMAKELETDSPPDKSHEEQLEVGSKDGELNEPKEFDWENYMGTYNDSGESTRSFNPEEAPNFENVMVKTTTLRDHLEWQLRMNLVSDKEEQAALILIDHLDENGYLTTPLEEIAQKENFSLDEVQESLDIIQEFDPIGVGARNLKECLLLQARRFKEDRSLLEDLITHYLHLLEKKDYYSLAKKLKTPVQKIVELAKFISEMEPKPGRPFGKNETQYITPDVYVYKVGEEYIIVLNEEGLPRLRISSFYQGMLSQKMSTPNGAKDYVEGKIKSAMWLIKSIHQRQRTLYRVSKCIVKFQKDFLEKGINYLKPMVLRDVAEEIGVHESTVSRATTNKYIHTPQGIFELKYFFNSGIAGTQGNDVASETVKEKIRSIVSAENAKRPLSDKEIADILRTSHIEIARRTVAKYREMLGILPSSKRKQLY